MPCEITVKLKNPMKSMIRVSPLMSNVFADVNDERLREFVCEVEKEFNDIVQKKTITIKVIEE